MLKHQNIVPIPDYKCLFLGIYECDLVRFADVIYECDLARFADVIR